MKMLNKITLMGRLTRDPELRQLNSGASVASFSLAVDRDFKNQDGEKETDFIDIVAWRNTAEFVSKYLAKGRLVVVDGRLQIRTWTDNEGNNRRTAEVVASNVYPADSSKGGERSSDRAPAKAAPKKSAPAPMEDDDEELPF
jgi:single-strand DNA-binding protein